MSTQEKITTYVESIEASASKLVERWSKYGMMEQLDDPYIQKFTACLLENQRLINETSDDNGDLAYFKRISIPLVRRVYSPTCFVPWDIVSVQAMLGPKGFAVLNKKGSELYAEPLTASTMRFKTLVPSFSEYSTLDGEVKACADLAISLCEEICRDVIKDLKLNYASELTWNRNEPWKAFHAICEEVNKESHKCPNWIVTAPVVALKLKEQGPGWIARTPGAWDLMAIKRTGCFNNGVILIEDDAMPSDEMIVGYKGADPCDSAYCYAPYVPFMRSPASLDPKTFMPRYYLYRRHGKRLSIDGSVYYGMVHLEGGK